MEALRQKRKPLRTAFTRTANLLEEEVRKSNPNPDSVASLHAQLVDKGKKLEETDRLILGFLQDEGCTQEQFDVEYEASEVYQDRLITCDTIAKRLLAKLDRVAKREDDSHLSETGTRTGKRKFKLPKIELKKFGGDPKDWLGFWGQFKKIHEDEEIDPEDKYQYLMQATVTHSKARELVESFPPTAENYPKAVEYLKTRFGRDDILVEVYVRELLRLVLNTTCGTKTRQTLADLYDKFETQLRALETFGVTTDKYAAMLYPLVEACLPEDVLRAFERHRGASTLRGDQTPNRLTVLISFLRSEVEGEERINMTRSGLGLEKENRKKRTKQISSEDETDVPTTSDLFSGNQRPVKEQICVFCEKTHLSEDCRQASKMSFSQKREVLVRKGCCFICFKKGHRSRFCKSKPDCPVCKKRHFLTMCPNLPAHKIESTTQQKNGVQSTSDSALSNQAVSSEVLLQTIRVRLRGRQKERVVRVLIDTGSQRSYITMSAVQSMDYTCIGEEKVVHGLFGGIESNQQHHRKYRVFLSSLNGSYKCNFETLDQPTICGHVPSVQEGTWMQELRERGITLTDYTRQRENATARSKNEIQVLIGADVAGKLLTGKMHHLQSRPVAVETLLGWTLMGKVPNVSLPMESSFSVISLFVKQADVADLWKLDSLGITDSAEMKSREELQKAALEHFRETVQVNSEGRYQVSLPWLSGHPPLSSGKRVAERRLDSAVRKLKSEGLLEAYQGIFSELASRRNHRRGSCGKRESSQTTKIRPDFDASAHEANSPSLNDCLEKGPNLLEQIPSILARFRLRRIGVVSDIRQAFLQIAVNPRDRDFLRFLWWEKGDLQNVKTYRHCRVVFGISSSPFLLGATLTHHLQNPPDRLRSTAELLSDSFYVDNCVASLDTEDELHKFINESQEIMSSAKFDLRGWRHSSPKSLLGNVAYGKPVQSKEMDATDGVNEAELGDQDFEPVLGMSWNFSNDTLSCSLHDLEDALQGPVTKRKILSVAHRIFDPIGFSCPVTLYPKLLLQETWELKIGWDHELPTTR